MKMRRHRVFLLCTVGLCVISFLHYYKALHYVSLLRELSAPYPNIKSFIMVTGFFWREKGSSASSSSSSLSSSSSTMPLSPSYSSPEEAPPLPLLREPDGKEAREQKVGGGGGGGVRVGGEIEMGMGIGGGGGGGGVMGGGGEGGGGSEAGREIQRSREELVPPHPWEKPQEKLLLRGDNPIEERSEEQLKPRLPSYEAQPARPELPELPLLLSAETNENKNENKNTNDHRGAALRKDRRPLDPIDSMGDLHTRTHQLKDDKTSYFARTKAGALCFRQGTEVATPKEYSGKLAAGGGGALANGNGNGNGENVRIGQRKTLQVQQQQQQQQQQQASMAPRIKARARGGGKRLVKCVCKPGWHGPYCGVPTMVYHSNLPTKERLTPRDTPRRVINAINVNHEFDLLHARFKELGTAVDLFLICESNFTAYGERRPLSFMQRLLNGTYDYVRHKILYVFLDHFPEGGRQDGWIADDYLRTFLTHNGLSRVTGARPDDVFVINDADEIPALDGLLFLKLFDGWTEPFAIHMRKSLYGFFWKQFGSLEVVSGCTVGMLRDVYDGDGIKLRRREYYTMPGFRRYENATGHILVQWSLGSPFHFAGWHCSWCFPPEGIFHKLVSAQNGDFPRWGDYEDKRDLNYIRDLIRTGGWFDGTQQEYPPVDPKEHMYAPRYMLEHYERYRYLLENPYVKKAESPIQTE